MNRDAHQGSAGPRGSTAPANGVTQAPAAGKQTLAQHAGQATSSSGSSSESGWGAVLDFTGVRAGSSDGAERVSAGRQQEQGDGTVAHALAELQREAEALVMGLELHRATGIVSPAGEGGFYKESLRELTRRVEEQRARVPQRGAAGLAQRLADVQGQLVQGYQQLASAFATGQPDGEAGGAGATAGSAAQPVQRLERGGAPAAQPERAFAAAASGASADVPYRAEMEARFGADFSSVQSFAGRGLDELGAHAATRGEQVVFSSATPDRQTVAHELTHVLQSRQGHASGGKAMSDPGDASEQEARGVAAAVAGPGSTSQAAVSAAPSGAIHRQEERTPPHPSHLDNTQGQARPINWDAPSHTSLAEPFIAEDFGDAGSAREIYNYYLLRNLRLELPGQVAAYTEAGAGPELPSESLNSEEGRAPRAAAVDALLAFLNARMAAHLAEDDAEAGRAAAEAIRVPLFRASQQAVVRTLNVEQSPRYAPLIDAKTNEATTTFCNVFAYDMVTAMGAYLPRVWWTDPAAAVADPTLDANMVNTIQLSANALYQWMLDWGPAFGWRSVATPADAQAQANLGKIVVILAGLGVVAPTDPGHISVVMAESEALGIEGRGDGIPLQAQAGAVNYSNSSVIDEAHDGLADTATGPWWEQFPQADLPALEPPATRSSNLSLWSEYASGYGFFVYDGAPHGEVSIRTPEETGLVLPEAAAPATEGAESTGS